MRQVPRYLLIGNGNVAHHFQHYFKLLQISFSTWSRKQSTAELRQLADKSSHILILISDDSIEKFISHELNNVKAICVHFSGSLVSSQAYGAHPLMTFNNMLYTLEQYQAISFVIDNDAPEFENLLPGLPNIHVRLEKSLKAKYHALCVLGGNLSCILWQKLFYVFEHEFKFPRSIAHPYLLQQMQNILCDPASALTGPLARNDKNTIENNLAALAGDPFQEIYKSFVSCYQQIKNQGMKSI